MTDGAQGDRTPKLLTGGNPQIPKGEGPGPVRDYIAAMPEWKQAIGRRLDDLIVDVVPDVHKGVKWNQPIYGHERQLPRSGATEVIQASGDAVLRHPRERRSRRGPAPVVDRAGESAARPGPVIAHSYLPGMTAHPVVI